MRRRAMNKSTTTAVVLVSLIAICGGFGCAALSDYVTPADIDPSAVKYVDEAGVADANEYGGYGNLDKARKLKGDVDVAHGTIQLDLRQKAEKDSMTYAGLRDSVSANYATAVQVEEQLFGPTGLLTMGLSMAGFGTLTGLVGLMRKRPGDVTSAELETAVGQAVGDADWKLTEKQGQFVQLVQGIAKYMASLKDSPASMATLKEVLNGTQDTETQVAVDAVKRELNL
jgi:hypothetical protein